MDETSLMGHITQDIHLVDDLKVNLLIEMNIIEFKQISMNILC